MNKKKQSGLWTRGYKTIHIDGREVEVVFSPLHDGWYMKFSKIINGRRRTRKVAISTWALNRLRMHINHILNTNMRIGK